jgi:c-di-GMP-binding flagellar brake protein YcgR
MDERRRSPRTALSISAFVAVDGIHLHAKTLDVSSTGLGVRMFRGLPAGTTCEIELRWMDNRGTPKSSHARTTVVHSVLTVEGGYRVGMRFEDMDSESRTLLSGVLD